MPLEEKTEAFRRFWRGEGPSLILIPTGQIELYDTAGYAAAFEDPERMWQSEMRRAEPVVDWPTDGIPAVRPNLGVIFAPSIAGLGYKVQDGQMPWPGEPLDEAAIRAARGKPVAEAKTMRLAAEFYQIHRERGPAEIAAYQADTQGVFDIAHLLYGEDIFYDLADRAGTSWVEELLEIALELYVATTCHLKQLLGESPGQMVHGHGSPQGIFLPHAGARIAEDTAILLSPAMIDRFIMPTIERCLAPFGGGFAHFCGKHPSLFERLCRCELVRAIDLGNPEMYDPAWLLERCAESGTVLFSRLAGLPDESWQAYVTRLAALVRSTGARCILRPVVFPTERAECAAMRQMWHELTG